MRILIAEDDLTSRRMLESVLSKWGYEVTAVDNGEPALEALKRPGAPRLAILDWMMPGMDGIEVCRELRKGKTSKPPYLILLTARDGKNDIVEGLEAGANDYITKPYDIDELRARVNVGSKVVELESHLILRVAELQDALEQVKTLQGIIPICMHCHKIRNDEEAWQGIESYIERNSEANFSHGVCPECLKEHYPEVYNKKKQPV